MKIKVAMVAAVLTVLSVNQAEAYTYRECLDRIIRWNSPSLTIYASPRGFPSGYWRDTLRDAIDKVNLNPSAFRFDMKIDSGGARLNNGQSEIWWSRDTGVLNGAPATSYSWWTCKYDWRDWFRKKVYLREVDIVFNHRMYTKGGWTGGDRKKSLIRYGGKKRLFQGTAVHELGHAMGLGHENREYNIMGASYSHIHANGSKAHTYFGEDAAKGAITLYSRQSVYRRQEGPWEDVGVVHWRYTGSNGEYSSHGRTRIFDTNGVTLPVHTVNGETGYSVRPGQEVMAEFTFENNGESRRIRTRVGFFISTNDAITTTDRRIGGTRLRLYRGDVWTKKVELTIPENLESGKNYWIGAIVDEKDDIDEAIEWNNATYIPIRVN